MGRKIINNPSHLYYILFIAYTVDDTMNECFKIPLWIKDIANPNIEYETIRDVDHTISIHNLLHTLVESSHIKKNNASFLGLFRVERSSKCPVSRMTEYFQMNLTRQAMSQFSHIDQNHQERDDEVVSNTTIDVDVDGFVGQPKPRIPFFHYVNIQKPAFVTLANGIRIIYYALGGMYN